MKNTVFWLLLLCILLLGFVLTIEAQITPAVPSGYTEHYRLRMYTDGQDPSSDSLNANSTQIDAALWNVDSTLQNLAGFDSVKVSGDTLLNYSNDNKVPHESVLGRKGIDTVFIDDVRFKKDIEIDGQSKFNRMILPGSQRLELDSVRLVDDYSEVRFYLSNVDTNATYAHLNFTQAGDTLRWWFRNMLYKMPILPPYPQLYKEGTAYYIKATAEGRRFFVNSVTGIDSPQYFATTKGVRTLKYASFRANIDSNSTKMLPYSSMEDSAGFVGAWTITAPNTVISFPSDVISTDQDPLTTKSLRMTSNNPTVSTATSAIYVFPLTAGKTYQWGFLTKVHNNAGINSLAIKITLDSDPTIKFMSWNDIPATLDEWMVVGGGIADTFSTVYQYIRSDKNMQFDDVTDWVATGNCVIERTEETAISELYSGLVRFTTAGNGTTHTLALPDAEINDFTAANTYHISFWAFIYEDEITYSGTENIRFSIGDYNHAFNLTRSWTFFEDDIVATASTIGDLKMWLEGVGMVIIDDLTISKDLGTGNSAKVTISINCKQDLGVLYVDNFIIRELSDSSWGWLTGGDAIVTSGVFPSDSLYINGQYVKGKSGLPFTVTSKAGTMSRLNGNWSIANAIEFSNQSSWIAVNNLYVEKYTRSAFVLSREEIGNGRNIFGWLSDFWSDSTGLWDRTLGIGLSPRIYGAHMGIDIRGNYTRSDRLHITNTANDIYSAYGEHNSLRNSYLLGAYNDGNGDGLQLKTSNNDSIVNNYVESLRHYKLSRGEGIYSGWNPNYDNKSGVLLNRQGDDIGSSNNYVADNTFAGFSNGIAGFGQNNKFYRNLVKDTKLNILSGSEAGGDGINVFGKNQEIVANIVDNTIAGIVVKKLGDTVYVANNTVVNFNTYGILIKNSLTQTSLKYEFYNNIVSTTKTGTVLVNIPTTFTVTLWNNNLYYSPENLFSFQGQATFSGIQDILGYDLSSYNTNPNFVDYWRLSGSSIARNHGTEGNTNFTHRDFYSNPPEGFVDMGAIQKR